MKVRLIPTLLVFVLLSLSSVALSQSRARRVGQASPTVPAPPKVDPQRPPTTSSPNSSNTQVIEEVGPDDVVRVNTSLVTIPVSVSDRDGRFIYNLRKEDFRVYDNGEEQKIAYFAPVEKPFTVVLVIDTSTSIWNKLGEVKEAAIEFLDQLRPDDQVMVATFSSRFSVISQPTSDREVLRDAIRRIGRGSSTHLYDAMDRIMNYELLRFKGRKAVVLFTDGVDATSSRASYESNVQDAEELDGLIYPIRFDTYSDMNDQSNFPAPFPIPSRRRSPSILWRLPMPFPLPVIIGPGGSGGGGGAGSTREEYEHGRSYLYDMAAKTGGRVYEATEDRYSMDSAFRNIAEELRHQYSIGYYPRIQAQAGEQRRVRVRVNRPDVAVRARDSYIFNPGAGKGSNTADDEDRPQSAPVLRNPLRGAGGS